MVRVSIDTVFFKNELLRMSVSVLRTIELEALQIFKAVMDFGGVTRAAAHLHRVPSNVTTRLKQLEEGLGTKLFHRHSRKLLLSSEGNLLLAYAERPLNTSPKFVRSAQRTSALDLAATRLQKSGSESRVPRGPKLRQW